MKTSTVKIIKIFIIFILIICIDLFMVRRLSFFEIKEVNVTYSQNLTTLPVEVYQFTEELKGKSLFKVSPNKTKGKILQIPFVNDVTVKRFYPSKLEIDIVFSDMKIKCFSSYEDTKEYFLANEKGLYQCDYEMYENYGFLQAIMISKDYSNNLIRFGLDNGFKQMLNLCSSLESNNLISSIKYDNNNLSDFGRLSLFMDSKNAVLRVLEPVEPKRLKEALELVNSGSYDLYSGTMIRRNQEDSIGSR